MTLIFLVIYTVIFRKRACICGHTPVQRSKTMGLCTQRPISHATARAVWHTAVQSNMKGLVLGKDIKVSRLYESFVFDSALKDSDTFNRPFPLLMFQFSMPSTDPFRVLSDFLLLSLAYFDTFKCSFESVCETNCSTLA